MSFFIGYYQYCQGNYSDSGEKWNVDNELNIILNQTLQTGDVIRTIVMENEGGCKKWSG